MRMGLRMEWRPRSRFVDGRARHPYGMCLVRGPAGVDAAVPRRGVNENETETMALPFGDTPGAREPRTLAILAKTIYRELRSSGFETRDVIALAGELLAQVTAEVRDRVVARSGDVAASAHARPPSNGPK
jgi:hypothetical protein